MSSYYYNGHQQQHPTPTAATPVGHSHHGGRNRRAPRLSMSQNANKQLRQARSVREMADHAHVATFRTRFEAGRSFDLEDDMEFCPALLTESDLVSIHSASSERSSLASNSPKLEHSPSQPVQVTPAFTLNSSSPPFIPPTFHSQQSSTLKLHQPFATRVRNAIPIINPVTGISMSTSPSPPSVSPGAAGSRMQQGIGRRW